MTGNFRRIQDHCLLVCTIACLSVMTATAQEQRDGFSDTKRLDAASTQQSSSTLSLRRMSGAKENSKDSDSSDITVSRSQREQGVTEVTIDGNPAVKNKRSDEQAAATSAALDALSSVDLNPSQTQSPSPTPEQTSNSAPTSSSPAPSPEWEFAVTPYLFTAGLSGVVGARGRSVTLDADFGGVLSRLDFGFMGTFEARKGNFVFFSDSVYIKLSNDRDTPGSLFSNVRTESKLFIVDPEVGYRVVNLERGFIDLLAGIRIWHLKNGITLGAGRLPQVDVSESKNWADPVVGARGIYSLSPRLYLTGKFDVGGFDVGSHATGQLFGGVGINVKPRLALIGGYRYLAVNYESDGFIYNTNMHGPIFGAKFRF